MREARGVTFPAVTDQEMRAAQVFTGATLALWLLVGYAPPVRRHARAIRGCLLAIYIAGCAGFFAYVYLG